MSSAVRGPVWHRSLYWRLGLGLVAFLALMLAAQAAAVLWMTEQVAGSMPARSPERLAQLVATDLGAALTEDPATDVEQYIRRQYGDILQAFLVVMEDGRTFSNHDDVPEELRDVVRRETQRRAEGRQRGARPGGPFQPRGGPSFPGERGTARGGPSQRPPGPRGGGPGPGGEFATIVVGGDVVGGVGALPGGPPFSRIVRRFGPTMVIIGGSVLMVGLAMIAFIVLGPVRRRLKLVQEATERLGGGDLDARVPDQGGDEVAAVARSFNRMADELAIRARALHASDTARRQLLADVSHELMTPLTAMRGYIETLTMPDVAIDDRTRDRYLQIALEESHRLEALIGDLLDLARLEGGGIVMKRDTVNVASLFERVSARHERELQARGITLERRIADQAGEVVGDADRLEQALQNLTANALRHTPDGGTIALTASRTAEGTQIAVRDNGPGIPAEHLAFIFDRFYKVDSSRRAAGGSGLGLSIVQAIVERHGGTIAARNDRGAVFEILLPSGVRAGEA